VVGKPAHTCLAVVLVVAAALRFVALDHGLPEVLYVDSFKFVD
jgi:hypothetical protein